MTSSLIRGTGKRAILAVLACGAVLAACADKDDRAEVVGGPPTAQPSASSPSTGATVETKPAVVPRRVRHRLAATAPLPGMPSIASNTNLYADAGRNMLNRVTRRAPYRIYVPNSGGSSVAVINPHTMRLVRVIHTGYNPQHVVPSYDLKRLYVTNDLANSLTPINPRTARRAGADIPIDDPYNMYFTPDGRYAIVVAEARQHLDFRDPHSFKLRDRVQVDCPGVDHIDFSANGGYLIATCEFSGRLVKINLHTRKVVGYLRLRNSSPQDIKLDPSGRVFYVADKYRGGVWLVRASTFRPIRFLHTGSDAHGLYPSRDARFLYVTNRGAGSVSVINFRTRRLVRTWHIPGGGSPDMGNTSPDGRVLWLSGRYNSTVYALSTRTGHVLARIPVGLQPHGLCVWPQPGRYSLGHTGVMR
jgi:DNA-binding beta-propeller fold protein YncE